MGDTFRIAPVQQKRGHSARRAANRQRRDRHPGGPATQAAWIADRLPVRQAVHADWTRVLPPNLGKFMADRLRRVHAVEIPAGGQLKEARAARRGQVSGYEPVSLPVLKNFRRVDRRECVSVAAIPLPVRGDWSQVCRYLLGSVYGGKGRVLGPG